MSFSFTRGDINSKLWVIINKPQEADLANGALYSGAAGYELGKWNIPPPYFFTPLRGGVLLIDDTIKAINQYKPAIIISLGEDTLDYMCPSLRLGARDKKSLLSRYAGSILKSPLLTYEHYIIPTYSPIELFSNWKERDITLKIDIAKAIEEYEYFLKFNTLQPLPLRNLVIDPSYAELMDNLSMFLKLGDMEFLSTDIETLRIAKDKSHPGLIYVLGLAPSPTYAISFCPSDFSNNEQIPLFRALDEIFRKIPQIGQNYFNFDVKFLESLGFSPCLDRCKDTKINHHILWPSLPHSLQFMTRQYTREPYYKDEGKGFTPRNTKAKLKLKNYNALDVCVTYEVFLAQQEELKERGLL